MALKAFHTGWDFAAFDLVLIFILLQVDKDIVTNSGTLLTEFLDADDDFVSEAADVVSVPVLDLAGELPVAAVDRDVRREDVLAHVLHGADVFDVAFNAHVRVAEHRAGVAMLPHLAVVVAADGVRRRNQLAHVEGGEVVGEAGDFERGQWHLCSP